MTKIRLVLAASKRRKIRKGRLHPAHGRQSAPACKIVTQSRLRQNVLLL